MARHKRKRRSRATAAGAPANRPVPVDEAALAAQTLLARGDFRRAAQRYKELLRQERRSEWVDGLAAAYEGRAADLAGRDMYHEAAAIWEQRAEACETPLRHHDYIVWLLRGGRCDKAWELLNQDGAELSSEQRWQVEEIVAAMALAGNDAARRLLPDGSPLGREHALAERALRAYCAGDQEGLDQALAAIRFRSPYRSFRQILKALSVLQHAPKQASELLSRVPECSAFANLARAIAATQAPVPELFELWSNASGHERALISSLRGWSEAQTGFMADLCKSKGAPSSRLLVQLLSRHQGLLGEEYSRAAALSAIVGYPGGLRAVERAFGPIGDLERCRMNALIAEQDDDPWWAIDAWYDVVSALVQNGPDETDRLRAALVLRHIVDLEGSPKRDLVKEDLLVLEHSLELDPEHLDTSLRVIDGYRHQRDLRAARRCLADALERFPDERKVLLAAVDTSLDGRAFKKAADYARKLLALDPINPVVRDKLVEAHLSHARKQIGAHKPHLAHRELEAAANWAKSSLDTGRVELLRGILELAEPDPEPARARLRKGVELAGGGLPGRLHLLLEVARLQRHAATVLKQASLQSDDGLDSRAQILALIQTLNNLPSTLAHHARAALECLVGHVQRGVKEPYTQTDMELICEVLSRHQQFKVLEIYARRGMKRWPERPIFVFHAIWARRDGYTFAVTPVEVSQLERAVERSQEEGDTRTADRIVNWLGPFYYRSQVPFYPEPREFEETDEETIEDGVSLENLLDLLDDDSIEEIRALKELIGEADLQKFADMILQGVDPGDIFPAGGFEAIDSLPSPPRRKRSQGRRRGTRPRSNQKDLFE